MARTAPAPPAERARESDGERTPIEVLDAVQRRVLWLAMSIVHHANKVRATRLGREGRRPPGVVGVDRVDHDGAVVRAPARAGPRVGEAARRAGAARDQLPARAARRAVSDDAARVRRAAELSEPREGPGPGRLLDGLGRDRRDGDDLERARAPLCRGPLRGAAGRAPDRARRRRGARRGRDLGGARRPDGRAPGRGAVDRRPQPPVARPRRAGHRGGPARRDVRGGGLADDHGQVRPAAARAVRAARAARRCARGSTRCRTRSTSACCAARRPSCASGCRARDAGGARSSAIVRELDDARARGGDPRPRRPRPRGPARRVRARPTR